MSSPPTNTTSSPNSDTSSTRSATPPTRRIIALALAFALLLVTAACSDDTSDEGAPVAETAPTTEATDVPTVEPGPTESAPTPALDESVPCDAEPEVMTTADGVDFVRTPDACFDGLPDWPYEPRYVEIDGLRQAYVDEGPADGEVVLLLHGQPSWSYLYRHMIPVLTDAGYRVIAMDHLGMGRSDKPTELDSYSYLGHNDRLETFIDELALADVNLFVQDWGSLIGLRVAGLNPDLFATIAVGDGALPVVPEGVEPFPPVENPDEPTDVAAPFTAIPAQQVPFYDGCELLFGPEDGYFGDWIVYAMTGESFHASEVVEALTWYDLTPEEEAAYDAPFPSRIYMGGPRTFPSLVNQLPGQTAAAWEGLMAFDKPFLTLWAANDPGNLGQCATQQNLIDNVPGAEGQPHDRLAEASHFLQDDQGNEIATRLVDWYATLDDSADTAAAEPTAEDVTEAVDCGSVSTGVSEFVLDAGGAEHDVRVYVPTSDDGGSELPLVINFHGFGSTGDQQATFTGYEELAEEEDFIVVHPTAVPSSADEHGRNAWETLATDDPGKDDVEFTNELLDLLIEDYCVDATQVYATGMSGGGLFTSHLVCEVSDRLAAAVSVAAIYFPASCDPSEVVPFMAIHGTDDPTVPFDGDLAGTRFEAEPFAQLLFSTPIPDQFAQFAEVMGCDPDGERIQTSTDVFTTTYGNCDDGVPVVFHEVVGGGHSWPSSPLAVPDSPMAEQLAQLQGYTTFDIDATADAWAFFEQHTRTA